MCTQENFETVQESGSQDAVAKLNQLLHCGNERVELSAAKELLALQDAEAEQKQEVTFTVEIRVIGQEESKDG